MKKRIFFSIMIVILIISLMCLTGCSNKENEVNSQNENLISENSTTVEDSNMTIEVIEVGNYTLDYNTYVDKYGTTYTLNKDGTYSCESTVFPDKSGTGTFTIFYFDDSVWEFDYPPDIKEGWYIGFNLENSGIDNEKPWLFREKYNVEENNVFYDAQTDEIWELE